MAQITIYLPDDVAEEIRLKAKEARMSVSAFLAELARRLSRPRTWPPGFADLYGSCGGQFGPLEDFPAEDLPSL